MLATKAFGKTKIIILPALLCLYMTLTSVRLSFVLTAVFHCFFTLHWWRPLNNNIPSYPVWGPTSDQHIHFCHFWSTASFFFSVHPLQRRQTVKRRRRLYFLRRILSAVKLHWETIWSNSTHWKTEPSKHCGGTMEVWRSGWFSSSRRRQKKITQTTSTTFNRGLHKLMGSKTVRIGLKQAK